MCVKKDIVLDGLPIHQITPPHLRSIQPAQNFYFAGGRTFPQVISGDEGAGVRVGKVNHVNCAGSQGF